LGQTGMTPEEQERVYHQEAAVAAQQHQMAMAAATAAGMMKSEDGKGLSLTTDKLFFIVFNVFAPLCVHLLMNFLLFCYSQVHNRCSGAADAEARWTSNVTWRIGNGPVYV
jgi:hypothetical protein